jgi:ribosomal subunit interface protein
LHVDRVALRVGRAFRRRGTLDAAREEGKDSNDMEVPLRITFRDVERSDAIEASVRKHAQKLLTFGTRIVMCDVAIESPHRHKNHGRHYRVRIKLAVPGAELVTDRNPDAGQAHEDAYAAIDDAFDHAARVLRDYAAKRSNHFGAPSE